MERNYITFEEAREIIKESVKPLSSVYLPVVKAGGYVLTEDIFSPVDLPLWTNSAVDGYALNTESLKNLPARLRVIGEIKAGEVKRYELKVGEAVKIFTGSVVPDGADAVIEVEKVKVENGYVLILNEIKKLNNIRLRGEEVKKGDKVVKKGTEITPGVAGFLSMMGISHVKVFRKPKVFVIITGSEMMKPGERLKKGKIYDANSVSLSASLGKMGIDHKVKHIKDDLASMRHIFSEVIRKDFDIIIFTGGVSVGDYDFVRDILMNKVEKIFYKVRQKPGKPLFFGRKDEKFIFGLPGNPAAVITCFYEYVYPAIRKMMGFYEIFLPEDEKMLSNDIKKNPDRLYFLRGKVRGGEVEILPNQDSHMLSSFVGCDCFVLASEGRDFISKGEKVKIHLLPW